MLDRRKYTKKCLDILNTTQFQKLNKDSTKTMGRKVQNILWKINQSFLILVPQHHQAKYLSKLISPLSSSEYTVSSTSIKDFVQTIQKIKVPRGYHMVSFDVKSLFTNVSLKYTID